MDVRSFASYSAGVGVLWPLKTCQTSVSDHMNVF